MAYIVMVAAFFLYWLPTIHAASNKHHNAGAIGLVNLFFGWTVLGWIVAFIWAATKPPAQPQLPHYPMQYPPQHPQQQAQPPQYPQQQIGPWNQGQ